MTGIPLIIAFFIMVVVMIVAISKFKIHPFLSIMGVSLILALLALPLAKVPGTIGAGFSGTFSSLGIVIILGAMIGFFLEKTGAALTMADWVIRRVGDKHPELAILLMGWIVSIPVFCDSGYVILNPIRKAIVKKTGVSAVAMAVALSAGLYTSHVFIPPTPGPIAAAQSLGLESHMLMVILVGFLVSIPSLAAGYFYARYIGKKVHAADEDSSETTKSYDELKAEFGPASGRWHLLCADRHADHPDGRQVHRGHGQVDGALRADSPVPGHADDRADRRSDHLRRDAVLGGQGQGILRAGG